MKILEVAGSGTLCSDDMGPVSSVIFNLSKCFSEFDHDVTIADNNSNLKRKIPNNINLIGIDAYPRTFRKNNHFIKSKILTWKNEARFIKLIRNKIPLKDYDVIHFHEVTPAFIYLLGKGDSKVVYTSHTPTWANTNNEKDKNKLNKVCKAFTEKIAIKKSDLSIALGSFLKEEVSNANIVVIPNGIEFEKNENMNKCKARKELGIEEEKFIIVFVGRISYLKGIDILLRSVDDLKNKIGNLKIYFIGPFSSGFHERTNISAYAKKMLDISNKKYCEFTGFISNNSRKFELLLNCTDVFVLPSRFDNSPCVILEAMSASKPIVASNVGGIPEMVKDGINGYLFNVDDEKELAEKILYLYNNKSVMEEMGRKSRIIVEKEFTWGKKAQEYLDECNKLINSD